MPPYGVSFLEGMDPTEKDRPHGVVNPAAGRAQEAVRVLQLRLPRGPNFGGIAPTPLMQGAGAMGAPVAGQQLQFQQPTPMGAGGMNPLMQAILGLAQGPAGGIGGGGPIPTPRIPPILPQPSGFDPFPNSGGGQQGPRVPPGDDPVVRPSPNPGATPLTQRRNPQEYKNPFEDMGASLPYQGFSRY